MNGVLLLGVMLGGLSVMALIEAQGEKWWVPPLLFGLGAMAFMWVWVS